MSRISEDYFVLPVIQRRLVWGEEQMELLFDTLLKGNSLGCIMVMEEEKGKQPMFAFRGFTKDGTDTFSLNPGENLGKEHFLVIDGQQRLQAFYLGLLGNINGKLLFFNLTSDCEKFEFDFKFASEKSKLPKVQTLENSNKRRNYWYSVPELFKQLRNTNDVYGTCENIVEKLGIEKSSIKRMFDMNIKRFFLNTIDTCAIGLSIVRVTQSSNNDDTCALLMLTC